MSLARSTEGRELWSLYSMLVSMAPVPQPVEGGFISEACVRNGLGRGTKFKCIIKIYITHRCRDGYSMQPQTRQIHTVIITNEPTWILSVRCRWNYWQQICYKQYASLRNSFRQIIRDQTYEREVVMKYFWRWSNVKGAKRERRYRINFKTSSYKQLCMVLKRVHFGK